MKGRKVASGSSVLMPYQGYFSFWLFWGALFSFLGCGLQNNVFFLFLAFRGFCFHHLFLSVFWGLQHQNSGLPPFPATAPLLQEMSGASWFPDVISFSTAIAACEKEGPGTRSSGEVALGFPKRSPAEAFYGFPVNTASVLCHAKGSALISGSPRGN